ncbi:hypothetical protein HDU85_005407 [Gaertneriomyces sp. JEL0708]|nr:hypothetical protein HDU85_005407 [Gaertneriomyces sp. JEL0708]
MLTADPVQPVEPSADELVNEIVKLNADFAKASFWFRELQSNWRAKYERTDKGSNDEEEEDNFGKGTSFPDTDRTEKLDIVGLLRSQPKNVLPELRYHEELFKKFRFTYVEQMAKEGFLKRILSIPPRFPTDEETKNMEARAAQGKEALAAKKKEVKELKEGLEDLLEKVFAEHESLTLQSKTAAEFLDQYQAIREELREVRSTSNPRSSYLEEKRRELSEQANILRELEDQRNQWTSALEVRQARLKAVEQEIEEVLIPKRLEAEANANEAQRISRSKDPKLEELGKWYQEQIKTYKELQGLKSITHPSPTHVAITYDLDGAAECTLALEFKRSASTPSGWNLTAMDSLYACPIDDLIHTANYARIRLDDMLAVFTREVPLRLRNHFRREREIEEICSGRDGVSYDPETGEVTVFVGDSGKAFVIRMANSYPLSEGRGLQIVRIEGEHGEELEAWRRIMIEKDIKSLRKLVAMFL